VVFSGRQKPIMGWMVPTQQGTRVLLAAAGLAAVALLAAGPVRAAVGQPRQTAPAAGAAVQFAPAFAWTRVATADRYEFQISANVGMSSPVLGSGADDFFTRNTRATLTKAIPNGTYYWRVRALGADGSVSRWTAPRSFRKKWNGHPVIQTPGSGDTRTFPTSPVVLKWSGVTGAALYLVSVASDPSLSSIVFRYSNQDDPNGPPNIAATSAAIASPLPTGLYYWEVVPVDPEGNRGIATPVTTFSWSWPSVTTPAVTDLDPSPEVYDPRFSWDPVPGAARYEVEVNSSSDFAPGSKVCCSDTTIATSLSPAKVLKNDTYHWRVRALDPDGNAGLWNVGPVFQKTFDNVPPVTAPSIKNLHMRDNLVDPGLDQDPLTPGYQTQVPIVTWDPVAGASSYEADVAPYESGACNWSAPSTDHHWRVLTAVPAWTPLGNGWNLIKPYSDPLAVANETISLVPGAYCARVRARTDRDTAGQEVYGDYTYLDDGTGNGTAFAWTSYPSGASAGCSGYPCSTDYVTPARTGLSRRTPYFTWNAVSGAQSYFVLVSKDANFTSIVDYGFTHIPAYAPRTSTATRSYTDETTSYYWAVLPSPNFNGNGAMGDPLSANSGDFQKQSLPPSLLSPAAIQSFSDQPTFRWSPAEGARRYRLQLAADTSFSNLLDDVTTDATSYSSNTTYPADTVLYWRVRADDENLNGLGWSATGTFQKTLAAPVPSASNPTAADMLPVLRWAPVQGASSYDVAVDLPNGTHRSFTGLRAPAVSFIKVAGTGIWHWRVRAEFPKASSGETPGPYSAMQSFKRTIGQPPNAHTDSLHNHVLLHWGPRLGTKEYRVQIASSPDFSRLVEQTSTDNTSYAPTMTGFGYRAGGLLYWRVAAVDTDHNQGDWTKKQQIGLRPRMRLVVLGALRRGTRSKLNVRAQTATGQGLRGVRVRLTGRGVRAVAKRTGADGSATFTVRPGKKGTLLFTATKAGFQPEYAAVDVR
jgi:hypothetical protein